MIEMTNILFTHSTLNNKAPAIFNDYFKLKTSEHQHETINRLNSTLSIPKGSIELPQTRTNSGKKSIKYVCSSSWNKILKELSIKHPDKYQENNMWLLNLKTYSLKSMLEKHFSSNITKTTNQILYLVLTNFSHI